MVSVIIPNYNHAAYLCQRIDSVLNQTYQNFEVIILDDCSTDNSREIIECYRNHPRVSHIIYNESNSGSTFKQWNKGIALAKGVIIWLAESDDIANESFLETLTTKLLGKNHTGIVYCQSFKMNAKGTVTGSWLDHTKSFDDQTFNSDFEMTGREYIERFLIHKNTIPNASAVLFRKDLYLTVGSADEAVKYCSDWLTWIKMLLISDLAFIAKPLNYFRYHDESVIAKASEKKKTDMYREVYDRTMRLRLHNHLQANYSSKKEYEAIIKQNRKYIIEENGLEGVFEVLHKNEMQGWLRLIKASLAASTLSYVRLLWKQYSTADGSTSID